MLNYKSLAAATLALVLLTACGSAGDILGGGGSSSGTYNDEIRGTIESVDTASRSIYLSGVSGYTNMLSSGSGNLVRVYYDESTKVSYDGGTYRPGDLERGDQVAVRVDESGNTLRAESMTVLYDSSGNASGSSSYPSETYATTVRGTVVNVNSSRGTIEVNRGYGSNAIVEVGTNTPVYHNNTTYRVGDLERGDEIEIRTRDLGNGRLSATEITVVRNVSGGTYGNSTTNVSTIRGTVRSVNTSNRTIELESANWVSGFNSGSTLGNRYVVRYDANTNVDVSGRLYPVQNLERGDVVEVQVSGSGSNLFAERLFLVRDVNQR